ncbi:hypothetical protein HPB49_008603 [Dermacentor silvarum]|uniref:Uncharacterized protein n=1 Tax=Dermacentor silvarum TaxID=543639 RepID=A0ACB8C8D8_DERSI|nr:hypothetical protein HPB49_008603 [Dermacentor silvarum]
MLVPPVVFAFVCTSPVAGAKYKARPGSAGTTVVPAAALGSPSIPPPPRVPSPRNSTPTGNTSSLAPASPAATVTRARTALSTTGSASNNGSTSSETTREQVKRVKSPHVLVTEPDTSTVAAKQNPTVCVYVNHQCSCGPYLDPAKIGQLPLQLGPGSMNRVLREAVQACVDCALNEKNVYNLLRRGDGKVIINATFDGQSHTCRLPAVDKVSAFWTYLENLFEELLCCENFYSSQPLQGGCTKCASKAPTKPRVEQSSVEVARAATVSASTTPSAASSAASKRRLSSEASLPPQACAPAKIACVRSNSTDTEGWVRRRGQTWSACLCHVCLSGMWTSSDEALPGDSTCLADQGGPGRKFLAKTGAPDSDKGP